MWQRTALCVMVVIALLAAQPPPQQRLLHIVDDEGNEMGVLILRQRSVPPVGFSSESGGLSELPSESEVVITPENGDLESGETAWTLDAWEQFSPTTDEAHGGSSSLHFDGSISTPWSPWVTFSMPTLQPGRYDLKLWLKIDGILPEIAGLRFHILYDRGTSTNISAGVSGVYRSDRDWEQIDERYTLPDTMNAGSAKLRIERYYASTAGDAYIDDITMTLLEYPPVEAFMTYPNFRGFIHDDMRQQVELYVTRNDTASENDPVITVTNEGGGTVDEQTCTGLSGSDTYTINTSAWGYGEHHVTVSLDGASLGGETVDYEYPYYIVIKLPQSQSSAMRVRFDEDHNCILNGELHVPMGAYMTSGYSELPSFWLDNHLTEMSSVGLNVVNNYYQQVASIASQNAYMEAERTVSMNHMIVVNGMHIGYPYNWGDSLVRALMPELSPTYKLTTAEHVQTFVSRYLEELVTDTNTNILAIYTVDEEPRDLVPQHFSQYQAIRETVPDVPTLMVLDNPYAHSDYRNAGDIAGLDEYPLVRDANDDPLTDLATQIAITRGDVLSSRPIWAVMQWYDEYAADRWPTEAELKTMGLMAIVEGARGFFWWSWGVKGLADETNPERAQYVSDLTNTITYLKAIENVILAEEDLSLVASVDNADIAYTARQYDGNDYVIYYLPAENRSDFNNLSPETVTFTLASGQTSVETAYYDRANYFYKPSE